LENSPDIDIDDYAIMDRVKKCLNDINDENHVITLKLK
jgi:hypothetical protein